MKYQPPWTPNGFLISTSGTEYCVQREQTLGSQAGGLIYYLMRRRQGETTLEPVDDTCRTNERAVVRLAERLAAQDRAEVQP